MITTAKLLTWFLEDTRLFVEAHGGNCYLAHDPLNALEILAASPSNYFAVILDKGETPTTAQGVSILVPRIAIYLARNKGLSVLPQDSVLPLAATCDELRDRILSAQILGSLGTLGWAGRSPVILPDGMPLNAYELNFTLRLPGPNLTARNIQL